MVARNLYNILQKFIFKKGKLFIYYPLGIHHEVLCEHLTGLKVSFSRNKQSKKCASKKHCILLFNIYQPIFDWHSM